MLPAIEHKLRDKSAQYFYLLETLLYIAVGILLCGAALSAIYQAGAAFFQGITSQAATNSALVVLDQLLLVLMLVEIVHTVSISIRSNVLVMEPFLIVGLIASIRRVLVITMQAAQLAERGQSGTVPEALRQSMVELGLLGFLILVFAIAVYLLRRARNGEESTHDTTQ